MHEDHHFNSSSSRYQNYPQRSYPRDKVIVSRELQAERKFFRIEIRENERGRFLRITEDNHGRRNTVIVPEAGFKDFMHLISEVMSNTDITPDQK